MLKPATNVFIGGSVASKRSYISMLLCATKKWSVWERPNESTVNFNMLYTPGKISLADHLTVIWITTTLIFKASYPNYYTQSFVG